MKNLYYKHYYFLGIGGIGIRVINLISNKNKQNQLQQQIKTLAFPNATSDIANEVLKLIKE